MRTSLAIAIVGGVLTVGCGDDTTTGGAGAAGGEGAGASGGGTTSAGAGGTGGGADGGGPSGGAPSGGAPSGGGGAGEGGAEPQGGDCDDAADCPPDGDCVELTPGGFRVCQYPVIEATSCISEDDQCCDSTECEIGLLCLETPILPFCGGVQMVPSNVCAGPTCVSSLDCRGAAACVEAGTVGNKVKSCIAAQCSTNADCEASPGGICAPVQEPCCNGVAGLYCIYEGNCRSSADCGNDEHCGFDAAGPTCLPGPPICPA